MQKKISLTDLSNAIQSSLKVTASKKEESSFSRLNDINKELEEKNPLIKEYTNENFINQFSQKIPQLKTKRKGWGSEKLK